MNTDYIGWIYLETARCNVHITYEMKPCGLRGYLAVIFPILPQEQYELSELL